MNWFQTYNPVSVFISLTRAVLCILNFVIKCCVSLYQCCLGEAVCVEAKHAEGFWPCALTTARWQATKSSCMDPASGCGATHGWCQSLHSQQLVWEHLRGTSLRDYTLRKTVPRDCAVIGSIISELGQNTLIVVKSSRRSMKHLRPLPTSFLKHVLSHLYAKRKLCSKSFIIPWQR